ncbi:TPA: hypothetical protein AB5E71_003429 [Vibrio cholerae]|uniref:hypothetical protein n=1 Tax=Vibrio sp. 1151_11 TaxID=2527670 RepID=UPI002406E488|nr:hypothetical protein [Vibrio sp. 1151_11]MDF9390836.1 hypothetical protein [Vibrio sp. 1151_11]
MNLTEVIQVFMTILLARYALDLNPELHSKVSAFDNSFRNIIDSYRQNNAIELMQVTKSFFGYLSLFLLILLLISMYLFGQSKHVFAYYLIMSLTYSAAVWFAISWFSDKGKFAMKMLFDYSKMAVWILTLPVLDYIASQEVSITNMSLQLLLMPLEPLGISIELSSNIWINGVAIFLIFEGMFVMYLIFTTIFLAPIAISAFAFLFSTIKIANWATYFSRNRPLSPICFAILIIATLVEKLH